MIITRNIKELHKVFLDKKKLKKIVGFVPTMGALHAGHLSLIKFASTENDITVVSIFVNPTQFNSKKDLKKYPRDEERDMEKLKSINCDIVFIPEVEEMYPEDDNRIFDFQGLDNVMEGKYRNGHFNGVAQIVSTLFEIVNPNKAYFGKKDFQQVAIIKYLNENYLKDLNIEVVACDIIREEDGLAMSSRNMLLNKEQRSEASSISKTMFFYCNSYEKYSVAGLKSKIISEINSNTHLEVEYFDIVDNKTLQSVPDIIPKKTTACIAVYAGIIRLIDNFSFN
ncbi:MAG: pantoate--beta-alanine ligase [Bacteroidales bacterium]|nr:pantoate--beta-alanine ligase [Bacteroidales bacterium]